MTGRYTVQCKIQTKHMYNGTAVQDYMYALQLFTVQTLYRVNCVRKQHLRVLFNRYSLNRESRKHVSWRLLNIFLNIFAFKRLFR